MKDLISVIIPVFNTEDYLEKCLNSVIVQTYTNLEIILVDDGSRQPAAHLCDELAKNDKRIKVIHKNNGGLSSARNAGIEISTGSYITFLDSDDYVSPTIYEDLYKVASPNTIAVSHFVRVDEYGKIYYRNDPHIIGGVISVHDYIDELLSHVGDVSTCTKLFHRTTIADNRFDEGKLNEDLLFMISVINNVENLTFTDKIGYYYLCRSNSISSKYGKAIEDMVANSIIMKNYAIMNYPDLKERAWRFALFQHMAYLLVVPQGLRTRLNLQYTAAVKFLRKNFITKGLFNTKLTFKQKLIMIGLIIAPNFLADIFQKKH